MSHSPGPWRWSEGGELLDAEGKGVPFEWLRPLILKLPGFMELEAMTTATPLSNRAALIAKAPEMLSLLKELEWSSKFETDDGVMNECPECRRLNYEGHTPDCRLSALLRDLP